MADQRETTSVVCYLDRGVAERHHAGDLTHQFLPPLGSDLFSRGANQFGAA